MIVVIDLVYFDSAGLVKAAHVAYTGTVCKDTDEDGAGERWLSCLTSTVLYFTPFALHARRSC